MTWSTSPPLDCAFALEAFGEGTEYIGAITSDLSFVDQPGQSARAGKNRQERRLRKRHRRRAVIDEDDFVARQGQLVSAARGGAVARGDETETAVC